MAQTGQAIQDEAGRNAKGGVAGAGQDSLETGARATSAPAGAAARPLIGTQGWTGSDWERLAYPRGLPGAARLGWYARIFDAVEVNSTFYAIPSPATVRGWKSAVPARFVFAVKMPRVITHEYDLTNSAPELSAFLNAVSGLDEKLGPVLVQLPPGFGPERLPELARFFARLPTRDMRFFLDIRSPVLRTNAFRELLDRSEVGLVTAGPASGPRSVRVSRGAAYIRWLGSRRGLPGGSLKGQKNLDEFKRECARWAAAIRAHAERGTTVYGFFANDYFGFSLLPAAYLLKLLGRTVELELRAQSASHMQVALSAAGYPIPSPPGSASGPVQDAGSTHPLTSSLAGRGHSEPAPAGESAEQGTLL